MTNLRKKMLKLKMTKWKNLTLGEKVLTVVAKLVKWALIIAVGIAAATVVAGIAIAIFVAYAIIGAISGGFYDASNAYRTGDCYVHFR